MKVIKTKVCVVGGGSGGFGCVYRLIKNSIDTVVVDSNSDFGGTSVFSGVNCWEPGVSLEGVHNLLKDKLLKINNGAMVSKTINNGMIFNDDTHSFSKYPWGLSVKSESPYSSTLMRCEYFTDGDSSKFRRFQFDDFAMIKALNDVVQPYKKYLISLFGYKISDIKTVNNHIVSAFFIKGNETVRVDANYFVDSTGSIVLARMAECKTEIGSENKDMNINGVTYVFRVSKSDNSKYIDDIPFEYKDFKDVEKFKTISCFNMYPNGDININMLPTISGESFLNYGKNADTICHGIIYNYWNYLQKEKGMQGYQLTKIFNAGIREDYRIKGKYVLTQNDIEKGILKQDKFSTIVAIADHAMDMHADGGGCKEIKVPYGIPIECGMTNEYDNLFVACRGASFSHIAASTARLSRTMLSFGEGVGEYISEMINNKRFKNDIQNKLLNDFVRYYF